MLTYTPVSASVVPKVTVSRVKSGTVDFNVVELQRLLSSFLCFPYVSGVVNRSTHYGAVSCHERKAKTTAALDLDFGQFAPCKIVCKHTLLPAMSP